MARDRRGVKSIFDEAAKMAAREDRAAYLECACCGNDDVRHEVDALLRCLENTGSFLEASPTLDTSEAVDNAALRPGTDASSECTSTNARPFTSLLSQTTASLNLPLPLAEGPGSMIGPYKLAQKIGEGGMGAVFMAEQEKPVRRKVALKVIKPGMDTGQVIARFEAERQALAILDHPNIRTRLGRGRHRDRPPFLRDGAGEGHADHRLLRPD